MNQNRQVIVLVALLAAGLALVFFRQDRSDRNALDARSLATRFLAEHLARSQAGKRVLVLSNPYVQGDGVAREIRAVEDAGVAGLKEGFGSAATVAAVEYPELRPEARDNPRSIPIDAATTTPLSYLVAEDAFDKAAARHPKCELVVSLIGLPANLGAVQCWQTNGPPAFALLLPDLRMIGNAQAVKAAMTRGKLLAYVLPKPGGTVPAVPLRGKPAEEFAARYLLVTPDNFEAVMQEHPELFPQ